jgi:hypothetical protein
MKLRLVVFLAPALDHEPRFADRDEETSVQSTIAERANERLATSVLPWAARLDSLRHDPALRDPFLNPLANELGAVVALDDAANAPDLDRLL